MLWWFQNRIPFIVPERVPWKQMCEALSSKFMAEVQTQRCLDRYNLHFLAQKIFDQPDISEDFSNMPVSWAQFNKVLLTCICLCALIGNRRFDWQIDVNDYFCDCFITGSSAWSKLHLLAVVWRRDGSHKEMPERLLEWRVQLQFLSLFYTTT